MIPFYLSCDPSVWLLAAVLLVPLVAGLALLFMPYRTAERWGDALGLSSVIFVFAGALILWMSFAPEAATGYDFLSATPLGLEAIGARFQLGLNALSLPLFLLTALIGAAAGFYTYGRSLERRGLFWAFLLLILSSTLAAFACVDLFYAFLFHEVALLPTFFALMLYGGSERKAAAFEMGIFLLLGSLLTLVGIIGFHHAAGMKTFSILELRECLAAAPLLGERFSWGLLFWGIMLLSGLWPFYGWVPKLLTQAPTAVAMLVGGSLKFFGLYFILQGFAGATLWGFMQVRDVLSLLCVANILFIGLAALHQTDFKRLVAYAAAMHMGVFFLAVNSCTYEALVGLGVLFVGSGLATALLFLCTGFIKRRVGSLEMVHLGGLRQTMPRLSVFLMVGVFALMGLPAFVNFWGEFGVIVGTMKGVPYAAVAVLLGLLLTAAFGLRALGALLMGQRKPATLAELGNIEALSACLLVVPLVGFAIFPGVLTGPLNTLFYSLIPLKL